MGGLVGSLVCGLGGCSSVGRTIYLLVDLFYLIFGNQNMILFICLFFKGISGIFDNLLIVFFWGGY